MADHARPHPPAGRARRPHLCHGFLEALPARPGTATTATSPTRNSAIAASSCPSAGSRCSTPTCTTASRATNCTRRAQAFMAAASQYGFLISCESRISLHNSGPYKLADDREMIVRDFMDLSESDFPWLDGVAADVPYNNLTVTMAVKDCHFYLVDDWGSFESKPEFTADKLVGVGLYTSDTLSDGYRAGRHGLARGADRQLQIAHREGEGRQQQAVAARRRLVARPDDRRRRDHLFLDRQGPRPCRRRLRRRRLDDGRRARRALPSAVQRRIQPRRAGRPLHRHASRRIGSANTR